MQLYPKKCNDAFIDSGATHHFFHNRSNLFNYEHIPIESVNAAFSISNLIGKGTVQLPIDRGAIVEAFSANVLSVRLLLKTFKIDCDENENGKAYSIIKGKNKSKPVLHIPEQELLFPLKIETKNNALSAKKSNKYSTVEEWHRRVGHPSADRYITLSQPVESVPRLDRAQLRELQCAPCIIAKRHKAPTKASTRRTTETLELIHLDGSGKVKPSLSEAIYILAFFDDYTAVSYVSLLKEKSQLFHALEQFKARAETEHRSRGYVIKNIRLDQAGENLSDDVQSFPEEIESTSSHHLHMHQKEMEQPKD